MPQSNVHPKIEAAFGILFVVLAALILYAGWENAPLGSVIAAVVCGALGIEAIVSASKGRRSLLTKIGPLP